MSLLRTFITYKSDQDLIPTIALRGWSNITHIKSNMAAVRHLQKMDMTSYLRRRSSDYYEIWQADAKWYDNDYT